MGWRDHRDEATARPEPPGAGEPGRYAGAELRLDDPELLVVARRP